MISDSLEPVYPWGMRVVALHDLCNDGGYPGLGQRECLVRAGALGEIVNVGHVVKTGEPVYLVEFDGRAVGCMEDEIAPAALGPLREKDEFGL
nr:nitrogen fixation protein NifZ [Paraburkholderia ribeironis]